MSANPRSDLVSALRADIAAFNSAMDSFVAHRTEVVARNLTFVAGDMTGANATIVAAELTQALTDMNTIVSAIRSGGTISVGVWPNVIKIK